MSSSMIASRREKHSQASGDLPTNPALSSMARSRSRSTSPPAPNSDMDRRLPPSALPHGALPSHLANQSRLSCLPPGHGSVHQHPRPSLSQANDQGIHHQRIRHHSTMPHELPRASLHAGPQHSQQEHLHRHQPKSPPSYRHEEEYHRSRYHALPRSTHAGVYHSRVQADHHAPPLPLGVPPHLAHASELHRQHYNRDPRMGMVPSHQQPHHVMRHVEHRHPTHTQYNAAFHPSDSMHAAGPLYRRMPEHIRHNAPPYHHDDHVGRFRHQAVIHDAHAPPHYPPHEVHRPIPSHHRIPSHSSSQLAGSRSPSPPSTALTSPQSVRHIVRKVDIPKSPPTTPQSPKRVSDAPAVAGPNKRQKMDAPVPTSGTKEEADSVSTHQAQHTKPEIPSPTNSSDLAVDAASILLGLRSTIQRNSNIMDKSPCKSVGTVSSREHQTIVSNDSMDTDASSLPHGTSANSSQDMVGKTVSPSRFNYPTRLALPQDDTKLNSLHCFLRSELLEVFVVEKADHELPAHAPASCIGRVGLRCVHCALIGKERDEAPMATFYPKSIAEIYRLTTSWQRCHLRKCRNLPPALRTKWQTLRDNDKSRGKTHYWITSAKELGLVDSPSRAGGIHFSHIPIEEPEVSTPTVSTAVKEPATIEDDSAHQVISKTASSDSSVAATVVSLAAT